MRNTGTQLTAGLCLMTAAYPVWYWFAAWMGLAPGSALALAGGSLLLGALAWVHRRYGFPLERRSVFLAGVLARLGAAALGTGGFFLARLWLGTSGSILAGVFTAAVYLTAWAVFALPAEGLLSVYAFLLMCVTYFVSILLCFLQGTRALPPVFFVVFCGSAAVFTALRSHVQLRRLSAGRECPAGFYRFHALLTGGFLLLGTAAVLCGGTVGRLLVQALLTAGRWLAKLLGWVGLLMFGEQLLGQDDPDAAEAGQMVPVYPWLGALVQLGTVLLVLGLLWRFRQEFAEFLGQLCTGAVQAVRHLLTRKARAPMVEVHPEYTDSVELLDTGRSRRRRKQDPVRQARRRWRRLQDPREKYRAGYALWLLEVRERGAEIPRNAPPAQILEAAAGIPDPALTRRMTEVYYQVRYGTHIPDAEELREMASILRKLDRPGR